MNEVKEIVNVKSGEDGTYKVVVEMKPLLLSYHQALNLCGRDMIDVFLSQHGLGNCKANLTELSSTDSDNQISIVNQILTEDGAIIFECIVHKELSLQEAFTLCGEQNVREIFLQKNIALETISTQIAVSTKSLKGQEKLSHLLTLNKSLQKAINPCLVEFSMSPTHSFIFPRIQTSTSLTWSDNSTMQFPLMSPGCFENNLPVATNKAVSIPQVPETLSLNIYSNNQPSSLITKIKPIKQNNCISDVTSHLLNKMSCLSPDKPLLCWTSLSSSAQKQILKNIQATPKNKSSVLFFNSLRSPNASSLKYFSCLTSAASFMHNKKTISLNPRSSIQPKLFEIQDTYLLNPFFTENATTAISDPKIQDKLVAKSEMVFQSKFTESNPQSSSQSILKYCSEEISQCNYFETVAQDGFVNLNHQFNEATIQTDLKSKTFYKCRYCEVFIAHRLSFLLHEITCIKKVENCSLKSQPFLFRNTKEEIISNAKVTSSVITHVKDASAASASLNLNFDDIKPFKVFKGKKLFSESLSLNFSKAVSAVVSAHQTLSLIGYGGLGNENKNLISLANTNTAPENDVSPISNDSATPISNDSATPISNDSATPISNDSATPISNDSATIDLHEPFQVCLSKDVCSTQQSSDLKSTLGFLSALTNDSSPFNDKLCRNEKEISELIQVELTKLPTRKRKYFSSVWLTEPTEKNNERDRILLNSTPNKIDNKDFKINVFSPDEKITNIDCLTFTACQASNSLYKYNKNPLTFKTLHEVDGDQKKEALSNKFRNIFKKHQRTLPLPTMKSVLPSFHDAFLCKNKLSDNILDNSVTLISHIEDNHKNEISSDTSKYTRSSMYQRDGVDSVVINNSDLDLHVNKTPILLRKCKDIELSQNNDENFVKRNGASLKRPLPRSCKKSIPKTIMVKNVINNFQLKVKNKVSKKRSLEKLQKLPNKNDKKSYHNFCKESTLNDSRISNLKKKKVSADSIMNRLTPSAAKIAKKFSRKRFQNNNLHNLFEGSQFQFSSLTVSKTRHGREFKGFFSQQSFLNDANNCSKDLKKTIGIKEKELKSRTLCTGGNNTLKNHLKMLLEESATFSTPRLTGRTRQGREFKAFSVSPFSLKTVEKNSANTVHNSLSHAEKNSSVESNAVSAHSSSLDFFEDRKSSLPRFNQNKLSLNSSEELQKTPSQTADVIMRNVMESASTTDSSGKSQSNCRNRNKVRQPLLKIKFSKLFPSTHLGSTPLSEESEKSSKRPRNLISQLKPSMKDAKSSLTIKRNQLSTFFTEYNQPTKYSDLGSFQSPITKKFAFKNQKSETLSGSLCGKSSMIFQNEKSINLTCETMKKARKKQKCNRKYSDKCSPKTMVDSFISHLTIYDQNEQILSKTERSLPFRTQEKPTLKKNSCELNRTSSSFIETMQAALDLKPSSATENVASDTRSSGTVSEIFLKTFQKSKTKDSMMLDPSKKTRKGKYYKRFSPGFSPSNKIGFKDRPNVATDNTVINKNAARERSHYVAIEMEKVLRVNALLTSEQLADLAKDKGYKYLT